MADIVDMANKETAAFTSQALSDCRRSQLGVVKIHAICTNCGAVISSERRAAVPGVKLCVDCQEESERGNR